MPPPSKGPHLVRIKSWWYVAWTDGAGRSKRKATRSRDRRVAELVLAEALGNPQHATNADQGLTVDAALAYYFARSTFHGDGRETAQYAIDRLKEAYGGRRIASLSRDELDGYYTSGRPVARTTKARELAVLRKAVNMCAEANPPLILRVDVPMIPGEPPGPRRERWLKPEEARALVRQCRTPHLALFVELALATLARPGALYDLTWEQIDLTHHRIDLNPPGRTQTRKRRPVVPILPELVKLLQAARISSDKHGPEKDRDRRHVLTYEGEGIRSIRKAFERAAVRAGLEDVTPVTLRHTGATWMAQRGVPLAQIAAYLGHSIQRTTEVYIKHHPDYLREAMRAVGQARRETSRADFARDPPENA